MSKLTSIVSAVTRRAASVTTLARYATDAVALRSSATSMTRESSPAEPEDLITRDIHRFKEKFAQRQAEREAAQRANARHAALKGIDPLLSFSIEPLGLGFLVAKAASTEKRKPTKGELNFSLAPGAKAPDHPKQLDVCYHPRSHTAVVTISDDRYPGLHQKPITVSLSPVATFDKEKRGLQSNANQPFNHSDSYALVLHGYCSALKLNVDWATDIFYPDFNVNVLQKLRLADPSSQTVMSLCFLSANGPLNVTPAYESEKTDYCLSYLKDGLEKKSSILLRKDNHPPCTWQLINISPEVTGLRSIDVSEEELATILRISGKEPANIFEKLSHFMIEKQGPITSPTVTQSANAESSKLDASQEEPSIFSAIRRSFSELEKKIEYSLKERSVNKHGCSFVSMIFPKDGARGAEISGELMYSAEKYADLPDAYNLEIQGNTASITPLGKNDASITVSIHELPNVASKISYQTSLNGAFPYPGTSFDGLHECYEKYNALSIEQSQGSNIDYIDMEPSTPSDSRSSFAEREAAKKENAAQNARF